MTPRALPPPRVLLLHPWLDFHGGVPRSYLTYAREAAGEVELQVASAHSPEGEMAAAFAELSVPVHVLGGGSTVEWVGRLASLVRREGIDGVVCTLLRTLAVARLATWGTACRVIFYASGISLVLEDPLRRALFGLLSRSVPIAAVSRAALDHHLPPGRDRSARRRPERVIQLGVSSAASDPEAAPFRRRGRSVLGIPEEASLIVFTAEFLDWKRHACLFEAFSKLAARRPEIHLLLIGDGPLREALEAKVRAEPSGGRVHFTGTRFDARKLLGWADLYAHPAVGEGFGLALVEAMAAGVPVVAARSGALPELVVDGDTGLLFEPDNAVDLAARIEELLGQPERARRLGRAGRERCFECFQGEAFAARLSGFLLEALDARRSGGLERKAASPSAI